MLIHLTDTRPTSEALPLLFDSWAEHHLSKIASILLQLNESFKILEIHTIGLTLVIHTYLVPNCLYKCRVGIDFNDHHSNNGYCISQGAPSIFLLWPNRPWTQYRGPSCSLGSLAQFTFASYKSLWSNFLVLGLQKCHINLSQFSFSIERAMAYRNLLSSLPTYLSSNICVSRLVFQASSSKFYHENTRFHIFMANSP